MAINIAKIKKIPQFAAGKLRVFLAKINNRDIYETLKNTKPEQEKNFNNFSGRFSALYQKTSAGDIERFTTPLWKNFNSNMENVLLPNPPFDFLRLPIIEHTMFSNVGGKWMDKELNFLEKVLPEATLKEILEEDPFGAPIILSRKYSTSHNLIQNAHCLLYYLEKTGVKPESLNTIVEWGGGYGSLVRIIKRLKKEPFTYIGIDTPIFICLQWLFLASVFGEQSVNLITESGAPIVEGRINLVPLSLAGEINISADLFISTWALSESAPISHQFVADKKWFGAKRLLLAYQASNSDLPDSENVGALAEKAGAKIESITHPARNFYAFK